MNESQWTGLVGWMCQLWPHAPVEPDTAAAWWPFVADVAAEDARQAIAVCALEPGRRFPPGVGDIMAAIVTDRRDWFDAWEEVAAACRGERGAVRTDSDDPLVRRFVEQLPKWREQVDEGNPTLRAQFRDFYRQATDTRQDRRRLELAETVVRRLGGTRLAEIGRGDAA